MNILLITGYLGAGKTTLVNRLLANDRGLRAAVIVNDIGEVNIDADLIRDAGAAVENVIPLTNGCICCTLSDDLAAQIGAIAASGDFDHIVIEASGICEPMPIAYTISEFCRAAATAVEAPSAKPRSAEGRPEGASAGAGASEGAPDSVEGPSAEGAPVGVVSGGHSSAEAASAEAASAESPAPAPTLALDNIVAVVDCARLIDEFNGGRALVADDIGEDDVESLLVQQIEFCSTLVLNKTDLVTPAQLAEVRAIVRSLQKDARIVEAQNGDVPLEELLNTGRFDFDAVYRSAAWLDLLAHHGHGHDHGRGQAESPGHRGHDHHEHRGHHDGAAGGDGFNGSPENGSPENGSPELLEYGISTFVYARQTPFSIDKLPGFTMNWPAGVIRTKGITWIDAQPDTCFLLEQAGSQRKFTDNGPFASAPETKLVFIGRNMDRAAIEAQLDACLA